MGYTKILADYVVKLDYEDLPEEVIDQAKMLTLQVIGVSLAACLHRQGKEAIALGKAISGEKKESTILGDGTRVSSIAAAFTNGSLADVLDWEDCSWTGHPSAVIVPAALAIGESVKASGKQLITAIVAAFEVYQRIAMALIPTHQYLKTNGSGLVSWNIFPAAVAASKVLDLDLNQTIKTIGVAGNFMPVITRMRNADGRSDLYHYLHGNVCKEGILAALIAKSGVSGLRNLLDEYPDGYWRATSDRCDWSWMTRELGKKYLIMETLFKHWPANMWIQQYLDALNKIIKQQQLRPEDIEQIRFSPQITNLPFYMPEGYPSLLEAQFSVPYCVAMMLMNPTPGPHWYNSTRFNDPKVLDLASKVKWIEGAPTTTGTKSFEMFREGKYFICKVEVDLKTGEHLSMTVHFPKGHPNNRMTTNEFRERFKIQAAYKLDQNKVEKAADTIFSLEGVHDINELTRLLAP